MLDSLASKTTLRVIAAPILGSLPNLVVMRQGRLLVFYCAILLVFSIPWHSLAQWQRNRVVGEYYLEIAPLSKR